MEGGPAVLAVANAARESYGRLLTFLAARSGDVSGAEDALGDAFLSALRQWPVEGIPANPEAWLLAAGKRRWIDSVRRDQTRERVAHQLQHAMEMAFEAADSGEDFPDERLKLLFVCAHPAIDPESRTPLMLQTVLGLSADRIGRSFLIAPAAMGQRLVRAKSKIRDAGIPFEVPGPGQWPERVGFVLDAVYAAYNTGWGDWSGTDSGPANLAGEALWLARVLVRLMPGEPEVLGLLALMLHCEARRPARLDARGDYVPLTEQDTRLWNQALIREAEDILRVASSHRMMGRFQIEAAVQSVHAQRSWTGRIAWDVVALLYQALIQHTTSLGARIGRAIALSHARGPETGLAALDELPADRLLNHQPYWSAKAYLLSQLGRSMDASVAYERAIGLSEDPAVREFLRRRMKGAGG